MNTNGYALQQQTISYYQRHAKSFAQQTADIDMQHLYERFMEQLPSKTAQNILDAGCGSGRDAAYFANLAYQVTAFDASTHLIEWAGEHHSSKAINWQILNFADIQNQAWHHRFTGVWACASLLHIPFSELHALITLLLDALVANGVLYASFKYGAAERIENSRFFCDMNEQRWQKVSSKIPLNVSDQSWLSADKRRGNQNQWFNVLIHKG